MQVVCVGGVSGVRDTTRSEIIYSDVHAAKPDKEMASLVLKESIMAGQL